MPDSFSHNNADDSPVVVPLRPDEPQPRRRARNTQWLTSHVRDLVTGVEAVALGDTQQPTATSPAAPAPAEAPVPKAPRVRMRPLTPVTPTTSVVAPAVAPPADAAPAPRARRQLPPLGPAPRLLSEKTHVTTSHLIDLTVAADVLPASRRLVRRVAIATEGGLPWRHRVSRIAVASSDPQLDLSASGVTELTVPLLEAAAPIAAPLLVAESTELAPDDVAIADVAPTHVVEPEPVDVFDVAERLVDSSHAPTPSWVLIGAAVADAASIAAALAPLPRPASVAPRVENVTATAVVDDVVAVDAVAEVEAPDAIEGATTVAPLETDESPAHDVVAPVPTREHGTFTPRRRRPLIRRIAKPLWSRLTAAFMAFTLVVCVLLVGLTVTGHHPETVVTGSMVPTIPIGSMVITEKVPVSQLHVGDILVFPRPVNDNVATQADETIVHRIIAIKDPGDGTLDITTKGDHNPAADCWNPPACPVSRSAQALADRVVYILPGFGSAASDMILAAILFVVATLLAWVVGWGWVQVRRQLRA